MEINPNNKALIVNIMNIIMNSMLSRAPKLIMQCIISEENIFTSQERI